jgi:hypothetical protein
MVKFCLTKPFLNFIINSFKGFLKRPEIPDYTDYEAIT